MKNGAKTVLEGMQTATTGRQRNRQRMQAKKSGAIGRAIFETAARTATGALSAKTATAGAMNVSAMIAEAAAATSETGVAPSAETMTMTAVAAAVEATVAAETATTIARAAAAVAAGVERELAVAPFSPPAKARTSATDSWVAPARAGTSTASHSPAMPHGATHPTRPAKNPKSCCDHLADAVDFSRKCAPGGDEGGRAAKTRRQKGGRRTYGTKDSGGGDSGGASEPVGDDKGSGSADTHGRAAEDGSNNHGDVQVARRSPSESARRT